MNGYKRFMDPNNSDYLRNNLVSSMVCMTSKYFGKFIEFHLKSDNSYDIVIKFPR